MTNLRTFPDRIAELGFSVELPPDWISHPLPPDQPDFSNPTLCFPLALVTAPHAAIVFAVAARPVYENGTVSDWAGYLLRENGLAPRAIGPGTAGTLPALTGESLQASDLGPMVVRFAFLEDGGRLVNLSMTCPEMLDSSVRGIWFRALETFKLETPRGTTAQLSAAPAPVAAEPPAEEPKAPPPAAKKAKKEQKREAEAPSAPAEASAAPEPAAAPAAPTGDPTLATFAVADSPATLDPEHPVNVNLRNRGAGLVPRVVAVDQSAKKATVAVGAIVGMFDLPFGWHVIDDGKRTLMLDPAGKIQISLSIFPREGRTNEQVLDELEAQTRKDYPAPEFVRAKYGKIEALCVRSIADGAEPIEQYHCLYPWREESMVFRARITTSPDRRDAAGNLCELVLTSTRFDPESMRSAIAPGSTAPASPSRSAEKPAAKRAPAPATGPALVDDSGRPAWWRKAVELETRNDFAAAEKTIVDAVQSLYASQAIADLYRRRMVRLKSAGDAAGALAAFQEARRHIGFFASQATSGGEGAALSAERDEFMEELIAQYGRDPGV